ncbi:hypothetical protein AVANI_47 [Mycobacterium phage Avani]|uniref:GIY-YIG domain-containing protein n=2 Tax=Gracegardnervirinae TaxID=2946632 RepID=A0A386KSW2_9CAUD|nr:endonuclease [Mycobacterium phage Avani]YP_009954523.1 endonuclease [Mycobacterium phage ArcusAngelus]AFL47958.1 hypothetical protein AVANI_47 [Mycobacterium phage Avani]AYD87793.1 hypothetical protein SEA_ARCUSANGELUS_44 [Mycobacterium phage ArcusAngelus]
MKGDPSKRPVAVYTVYDAKSQVIYVGTTVNVATRMSAHRANSAWWQYHAWYDTKWFPNSEEASTEELRLITEHRPQFNQEGVTKAYVPHSTTRRWTAPTEDSPSIRRGVRVDGKFPADFLEIAESVRESARRRDAALQRLREEVRAAAEAGGSVREIARLTGKSTNTIQRWLKEQ